MRTTELKTMTAVRERELLPVCWLTESGESGGEAMRELERAGFPAVVTTEANSALAQIEEGSCGVVVVERAEKADAWKFLDDALALDPGISVVVAGPEKTMEAAVEAVKRGAYDYVGQPVEWPRLVRTLDELAEDSGRRKRVRELEQRMLADLEFHGVVGKSPAILAVFEMARRVAKHYRNVLVTGPRGSGKALLARAIHTMSPAATGRFGECNCAAGVETLLESQMFGHVRGAFPGASDSRPGVFEYANGGTVYLDEVRLLSVGTQEKLLRVLETHEVERLGSTERVRVDAHVIASSHEDMRPAVDAGVFREDLYYQLAALEIRVPGLVERLADIPLLVQFVLKRLNQEYGRKIQGLTRRAQSALLQYEWPGNVRELENVISGAAMLADGHFIDLADLPEEIRKPMGSVGKAGEIWRPVPLEDVKRGHIERVLELCEGNRVRASHLLGIGRTSLYRHLKRNETRGKSAAKQAVVQP